MERLPEMILHMMDNCVDRLIDVPTDSEASMSGCSTAASSPMSRVRVCSKDEPLDINTDVHDIVLTDESPHLNLCSDVWFNIFSFLAKSREDLNGMALLCRAAYSGVLNATEWHLIYRPEKLPARKTVGLVMNTNIIAASELVPLQDVDATVFPLVTRLIVRAPLREAACNIDVSNYSDDEEEEEEEGYPVDPSCVMPSLNISVLEVQARSDVILLQTTPKLRSIHCPQHLNIGANLPSLEHVECHSIEGFSHNRTPRLTTIKAKELIHPSHHHFLKQKLRTERCLCDICDHYIKDTQSHTLSWCCVVCNYDICEKCLLFETKQHIDGMSDEHG